jgi:hypothetical protein
MVIRLSSFAVSRKSCTFRFRLPPEVIFDQGVGDLFTVRVAGNVATPAVLGSIEYAVGHLGAKLVVVMAISVAERCKRRARSNSRSNPALLRLYFSLLGTCRSLSTLNTPGTELARIPAMAMSLSESTTPVRVTFPFSTMM